MCLPVQSHRALIWWSTFWSAAADNTYQPPAANFDTPLKGELSSFNLKRIRNNYKIEWGAPDMAGRGWKSKISGLCIHQSTKPARLSLNTCKKKQKKNTRKPTRKTEPQQTRKQLVCRNHLDNFCAIFLQFFKIFVSIGQFLKSSLNLLQYCLYFIFWFLVPRHVES